MPEVGDLKISLEVAYCPQLTLMGQQTSKDALYYVESLKLGDHSESTGLLGYLTQGVIGSEIFLCENASSQESFTTYL